MLLPVGAVSAVGVSIEKPVIATAETSGLQTAATPLAVLSSAVNVSVEGKLNMLLVAARERMLDSLLSAIDTAAQAVNVSREPGESNAAYAQRVAAAIRSLTPQQLVAAQQRVDAQMRTPLPLPLLANALEDPESPQAVQLALSLEQASAAEPDAVLKAVVNSYGQNAGEVETPTPQTSVSAPLQKAADLAALATALAMAAEEPAATTAPPPSTTAQAAPQQAPTPQQTPASGVPAQAAPVAVEAAPAQTAAQNGGAANPQAAPAAASPPTAPAAAAIIAASSPQPSQLASLVDDLAAGALLTAIAAEAELPTEVALIRSPLSPPPVPRDIQQIAADIKQGLQVVISPPAMANNSDLLQIISNPSSSVEKIIAQALMGNAAAQAPSPQSPSVNEKAANLASAMAASASLTQELDAPATALSGKAPMQAPMATPLAMFEVAEQTGLSTPLPLGVPFVVANYLPADAPVKNGEAKLLNRVDPVGDEEGEEAQDEEQPPQDQDRDEAQTDESPAQAGEEGFDESEVRPVPSQGDGARSELVTLPQQLRDPLHDHAFDFYRRMVTWE